MAPATFSVKVAPHITLEAGPDGEIAASFYGHSVGLGKFSVARRVAQKLHIGLPFSSFASGDLKVDKEIQHLARRLALPGLLHYRLGHSRKGDDLVVIEPQLPDYWPRMPPLRNADTLVLSRFAYQRRRGKFAISRGANPEAPLGSR